MLYNWDLCHEKHLVSEGRSVNYFRHCFLKKKFILVKIVTEKVRNSLRQIMKSRCPATWVVPGGEKVTG